MWLPVYHCIREKWELCQTLFICLILKKPKAPQDWLLLSSSWNINFNMCTDHICGGQGPWYILTRNSCQVCMEVEATCNPWDISSSLSVNFFQEGSINLLSIWYSNFQLCEYTRFLSLQFSYMLVALQIFESEFQWLNDQSQAADQLS